MTVQDDDLTVMTFVGKELRGFSIQSPYPGDPPNQIVLEFNDGSRLELTTIGCSDGSVYMNIEDMGAL